MVSKTLFEIHYEKTLVFKTFRNLVHVEFKKKYFELNVNFFVFEEKKCWFQNKKRIKILAPRPFNGKPRVFTLYIYFKNKTIGHFYLESVGELIDFSLFINEIRKILFFKA